MYTFETFGDRKFQWEFVTIFIFKILINTTKYFKVSDCKGE